METSHQNLSKMAKWILNQFIPESANWKVDIVKGFSGQDLVGAVKNGFTTDELADKVIEEEVVDPSFNNERKIKKKIYNSVSELKNIAEKNEWGFYIRSVPGQSLSPQKREDGMQEETKYCPKYRILLYDTGLLREIAQRIDQPAELVALQRRWVDRVGKRDNSKARSYQHTANNLLDAGREYTNLLDTDDRFELDTVLDTVEREKLQES